jgi:signal peptidase I
MSNAASTTSDAARWRAEVAQVRDTVESIGVAIILAFLLRAFLIEAFVIPTGSMAPRLMGEHFDLICPHCTWEYDHGYIPSPSFQRGRQTSPTRAVCSNCGQSYPTDSAYRTYVNGGDRVLVLKYLYDFYEPEPWDVVVFRNPQNNRENFIKRLIGLPGETIEIVRGDIWVQAPGSDIWAIRRKPDDIQQAMWQVIYDNDYPLAEPERYEQTKQWIPTHSDSWASGEQGRRLDYSGQGPAGLIFRAPSRSFFPVYSYNPDNQDQQIEFAGNRDVCTDLMVSCVYDPATADGRLVLMLEVLGHRFAADVAADGTVRLWQRPSMMTGIDPADSDQWPNAETWTLWGETKLDPLQPGRGYTVALTNVDYRLTLWIDDRAALVSTDEQYAADHAEAMSLYSGPTLPLPKVGVLTDGGPCSLRHIKLYRDVFYTAGRRSSPVGVAGRYARESQAYRDNPTGWERLPGWGVRGNPIALNDDEDDDLDSFYVLGDNSPHSLDSRRWAHAAPTLRLDDERTGRQRVYQLGTVPRYNLIGKAMFVYWPAGYRLPVLSNLPILPNVGKMRLIR